MGRARSGALVFGAAVLAALLACKKSERGGAGASCGNDAACADGFLCESGSCIPREAAEKIRGATAAAPPTAAAARRPPAGPRETRVGALAVVDVGRLQVPLRQVLREQLQTAKADGKQLLVITLQPTNPKCSGCRALMTTLNDPQMQTALATARVVRVDIDLHMTALSTMGIIVDWIPGLVLFGGELAVKDIITGGEWDEDIPKNMAPVLTRYLQGKLTNRRKSRAALEAEAKKNPGERSKDADMLCNCFKKVKQKSSCEEQLFSGVDLADCRRAYGTQCGMLVACMAGEPGAPPKCPQGQIAIPSFGCVRACKSSADCPPGESCNNDSGAGICVEGNSSRDSTSAGTKPSSECANCCDEGPLAATASGKPCCPHPTCKSGSDCTGGLCCFNYATGAGLCACAGCPSGHGNPCDDEGRDDPLCGSGGLCARAAGGRLLCKVDPNPPKVPDDDTPEPAKPEPAPKAPGAAGSGKPPATSPAEQVPAQKPAVQKPPVQKPANDDPY